MKTKKYLNSFFSAILALVVVLGVYSPALAQTGTTIKISPVLFDQLTANPGEQLTGTISVSNPGTQPLVLYPSAQNFLADTSSEEGKPMLTTSATPYGMMDWIAYDQNKVELAPGAKSDVKFFITVPKDAQPGGHYGSLLFSTKAPQGASESTQLKVESAVSALVLLKVNGDVKESGLVESFTTTGLTDPKQIDFDLRFRNTGNVHVKPEGTITITNWLGSKVVELPLASDNVLPDSVRKITTSWKPEGTLFGKYTATVTGNFGSTKQTFTATTSFGQYYTTTILIILIIIIFIILFIRMSSKGYKEELSNEIKEDMKR